MDTNESLSELHDSSVVVLATAIETRDHGTPVVLTQSRGLGSLSADDQVRRGAINSKPFQIGKSTAFHTMNSSLLKDSDALPETIVIQPTQAQDNKPTVGFAPIDENQSMQFSDSRLGKSLPGAGATTDISVASPGKRLAVFYATLTINILSFTLSTAIIPFFALSLGASTVDVALISSINGISQIMGAWILGKVSDIPRFGRRLALILQYAGVPLAYLMIMRAQVLWVVFIALVFGSSATHAAAPVVAYISDHTIPSERAKYIGIAGAIEGSTFTLGGMISAILLGAGLNFGHVFTISIVGGFSAVLIAMFALKEPEANQMRAQKEKTEDLGEAVKLSEISAHQWILFISMFTSFYASSGAFSLYSIMILRMFNWGSTQLAGLMVGCGIIFAIMQVAIEHMVKYVPLQKISMVAAVFLGAGISLLPFLYVPALFIADLMVISAALSLVGTSIPVQLSQETEQSKQGQIQGLTQMFQTLAHTISPLTAAACFDQDTGKIALVHAGILGILGSALLLIDWKRTQKAASKHNEEVVKALGVSKEVNLLSKGELFNTEAVTQIQRDRKLGGLNADNTVDHANLNVVEKVQEFKFKSMRLKQSTFM
jgi:DHA1 family tetracycline resistance protein-like MFS transporter